MHSMAEGYAGDVAAAHSPSPRAIPATQRRGQAPRLRGLARSSRGRARPSPGRQNFTLACSAQLEGSSIV